MTAHVRIEGMHCASCKALIEEVVLETPGVRSCVVDLERGTGVIEHDGPLKKDGLAATIAELGPYRVTFI